MKIKYIPLFFLTPIVFAKEKISSLGGFADSITQGPLTSLLSVVNGVCYLVGAGLILVGIAKFFTYRRNPHAAPLSSVIVYILLGIICLLLPMTLGLMNVPIGIHIPAGEAAL